MFLSAVWTLILMAPIHCRGSDVMLNFSKSVLMKKQTRLYFEWPEGKFSAHLNFWVNYSFNCKFPFTHIHTHTNKCAAIIIHLSAKRKVPESTVPFAKDVVHIVQDGSQIRTAFII